MSKIQRLLRELDIKIEAYEEILKENGNIDWEDYHWARQTKAWLTMPRDELIEDQTIDINSIKEMEKFIYVGNSTSAIKEGFNRLIDKQNEVIRALKHLNNEIQSIKEKQ